MTNMTEKRQGILVVDDDDMFCDVLRRHLQQMDFQVYIAMNLADGMKLLQTSDIDIILLDVNLPDGDGLSVLPEICRNPSHPEVIIITGDGDESGAEMALTNGAWDYVEKPLSFSKLSLSLKRVLEYMKEKRDRKPALVLDREGIVGEGHEIRAVLKKVADASTGNSNVLITGETGTGKEIFTLAIHKNSDRVKHNMVVVDCASLPENLVGSVLFGHTKGAFTGATTNHTGLMKQADGGTLFLDEVGELPLNIQKNLLRALQERRFRPVGGNTEIESDFRLISATNRNLEEQVEKGLFREDLLFRLQTIRIDLPPLRNRAEDIEELVNHYLAKICARHQIKMKEITPEFIEALMVYDWPGNIRELINTLEMVVNQIHSEKTLFVKHLPLYIRLQQTTITRKKKRESIVLTETEIDPGDSFPNLKTFKNKVVENAELNYMRELISASGKNVKEACRLSGVSRARLYQLLKKYNLTISS